MKMGENRKTAAATVAKQPNSALVRIFSSREVDKTTKQQRPVLSSLPNPQSGESPPQQEPQQSPPSVPRNGI
jgi:hypothetical protein